MKGIKVKKIFFARFKGDYGTEYEKIWLKEIEEAFPGSEVLSFPSKEEIKEKINKIKEKKYIVWTPWEEEVEFFFPLIDKSDIVVAAPIWGGGKRKDTGNFSLLVAYEIEYACKKGKRVIGLVKGEMRDIKLEDIKSYLRNLKIEYIER